MPKTFTYENGYNLEISDLAGNGILISLDNESEDSASILLPAAEVQNLREWLGGLVGGKEKGNFKADRAIHFQKG